MKKSTVQEIKDRFDTDVERFSNLENGQTTTVDATIALEILADVASYICPEAKSLLDVGCGAGNYSLKLLEKLPDLNISLIDLSQPMLDRAFERISPATKGSVNTFCTDIRNFPTDEGFFDIIVAGAVLHHLRDESEWAAVFEKFFRILQPGGVLLVSDLVIHRLKPLNRLIWKRYGAYLDQLGGEDFQKEVFAYIEKEDSPRSYEFQRDKLIEAGFHHVELLHKNICFATFCAVKEKAGIRFETLSQGETFG